MLRKVISGGQVGADVAGLRAARHAGLETGGWIPNGFRTKTGSNLALAIYGMEETPEFNYPPRTRLNVLESDGTIRFAYDFASRGERCTANAVLEHKKPLYDVHLSKRASSGLWVCDGAGARIDMIEKWIRGQKIQVLNVAGNANADIENCVQNFLAPIFRTFAKELR